jgi:hypothetical protein
VTEGQKALWVDRAFEERLTLSEWIRRSCDGGLGAGARMVGSESENGGQPEERASGVSPSTGPMAPARYPASPAPRSFRPDPKGGKRGLGSGEVAAGSPPVAGAGSPEPSPSSATGMVRGEPDQRSNPIAGGGGSPRPRTTFRPDPKKKP